MECEIKLEAPASPDRDIGADMDSGKGLEDPEECKKRKRKPYRPGECSPGPPPRARSPPGPTVTPRHLFLCSPGIGGFMVRQRKSHTRLKKVSAVLADVGREGLSAEGHPEDGRGWWHPFPSLPCSPARLSPGDGEGIWSVPHGAVMVLYPSPSRGLRTPNSFGEMC